MTPSNKLEPKATEKDSSKKRAIREDDSAGNGSTSKIAKLHPFFSKPNGQPTTFRWATPSLGPDRTCLHGINLAPVGSTKVAAFDLDGTIIKSNHLSRSTATSLQWEWWRKDVPLTLKALVDEGYSIVIISNQAVKGRWLEDFKKKIPLIAVALPDVPFHLLAATAKDGHRKPMIGMWSELESIYGESGTRIDKTQSFFVGDAAGRPGDFAATDRKWAINVGIPFFTPEEYFLKLPPAPYTLLGFNTSSLPQLPLFTLTSSPLIPVPPPATELVLFVGFPCLGKSSFFRRHFEPAGYRQVNQDILGSRVKCVKLTEETICEGKSCVIDNTNRDAKTRKYYLDLGKKLNIPVKCILFTGSLDLAWHNNLYRAYNLPPSVAAREPPRKALPYTAFIAFQNNYEEPKLDEGFSEIKKVNWVFEGSNEERRYWGMWLQIEGK